MSDLVNNCKMLLSGSGVIKFNNLTRVSRRKRDAFRVLGFLIS
jgi:hypothetical protein